MTDAPPPALMSRAEYANHRGCDKSLITRWVKAGKIHVNADGKIDAADADLKLGQSRLRINSAPVADRDPPPPRDFGRSSGGEQLTKVRTGLGTYQLRRAHLEWEAMLGKYVETDQVLAAIAVCGESAVAAIQLSVHAEDLTAAAGGTDQVKVRAVLKSIEFGIRTALAAAFNKMAAEASTKKQAELKALAAAPEQQPQ